METTRRTINLKTKNGHEVVMKAYLTGEEYEDVQALLSGGMSVKYDEIDGKPKMGNFDLNIIITTRNKAIELMVESVDGKSDEILKAAKSIESNDYIEILEKIDDLTGLTLSGKKKEDVEEKSSSMQKEG